MNDAAFEADKIRKPDDDKKSYSVTFDDLKWVLLVLVLIVFIIAAYKFMKTKKPNQIEDSHYQYQDDNTELPALYNDDNVL
jgi:hypothetical protein